MEPDTHTTNAMRSAGRPRRGTETTRLEAIVAVATRAFLRDRYDAVSIGQVAREAGVSTRTIYNRFRNKADLFAAVVTRFVERDTVSVVAPGEFDEIDPKRALTIIAQRLADRAHRPDFMALLRTVAVEARRFPALAATIRERDKARVDTAIADYFRRQAHRGVMAISDTDAAAALFVQIVCAELHEYWLLLAANEMRKLNFGVGLNLSVEIFMHGAMSKVGQPADDAP
jgi:TetR/AcrR family transcriptional regulator, mexJK operon transcriptional repressor